MVRKRTQNTSQVLTFLQVAHQTPQIRRQAILTAEQNLLPRPNPATRRVLLAIPVHRARAARPQASRRPRVETPLPAGRQ